MTIQKLQQNLDGLGEVKGFTFKQVKESENHYIYEVNTGDSKHYEVFRKSITPICVDFNKKLYSETEFKEVYPKAKNWGISAFTFRTYERAAEKLMEMENEMKEKAAQL